MDPQWAQAERESKDSGVAACSAAVKVLVGSRGSWENPAGLISALKSSVLSWATREVVVAFQVVLSELSLRTKVSLKERASLSLVAILMEARTKMDRIREDVFTIDTN